MTHPNSTPMRRMPRTILPSTALPVFLAGVVAWVAWAPALVQAQTEPHRTGRSIGLADTIALTQRFAAYSDDLPAAAKLGVEQILAYEENRHFVYIRGRNQAIERRILFCKPDTYIFDDRPTAAAAAAEQAWVMNGTGTAASKRIERGFSNVVGDTVVTWQMLPFSTFATLVHVGGKGSALPTVKRTETDGTTTLTVTSGERTFTLTLPADPNVPGTLAVSQAGKVVLPARLLPAGVMPHGVKGVRSLESWDSRYRGSRRPGWDVGRPATELTKAVEGGTIKPGRAVVLGCGTGTNAVYLAKKGFDVTALDIAPTSLTLAQAKARKAGVKVRWLVADVLAPPPMEPFDFIFDRGCYHGVRRVSATGYVKTVDAVSRPGTRLLIIAGNANEARHYGPPRVDETHLVNDFAKTWDFVWLKEIRLDSINPNAKTSPWAWSVLLRRRAKK